jgi:exopolysaccharide production protein ExoY
MNRISDIIISLFFITFFSPVMLLIYISITATGQKAIFKHRRIGINGCEFHCFKFTSMIDSCELGDKDRDRVNKEMALNGKVENDPRVTAIGKLIRKTSIDELPQFFNVLRGDMSIVGPRPITIEELKRYGHRYYSYISIKPGITGLWQVSGRSNLSYRRRVAMDYYYSKNNDVYMRMFIILKTVYVVLFMNGAK